MATYYTQYGEKIKYGLTELDGGLITSATITYAKDTKEYADHNGVVVAIVTDLNPRFEAEINAVLVGGETYKIENAFATWLKSEACSSTFCANTVTTGTTIITDVKIEGKNDDATTVTVSAVYYPNVTSSSE